jgi:hypothetical protein
MPGNDTVVKSPRLLLPTTWVKTGFTAGQSVGVAMQLAGLPSSLVELPLPRAASLVMVGIVLSGPVAAGLIRFELTKNGIATGKTVDMDSTSGTKQMWELKPGELIGDKGDEIGILWGSSGSLAPSGSIDGALFLEVQPV